MTCPAWPRILPCGLVLLGLASVATAGPNRGGTLVVHDTAISFSVSVDLPVPPASAPPLDCTGVDSSAPVGDPAHQRVWKVYAAFPPDGSPRLKGLGWGITATGQVYVTTAGLPDPPHCFQIVQGAWPMPLPPVGYPRSCIGQSFDFTQTAHMIECYWFGGYGYQGAVFSTEPHVPQNAVFIDDGDPQQIDVIAGYSSLGFGAPGEAQCPPAMGTCCSGTGDCSQTPRVGCIAPSVWHPEWETCDPSPCPTPLLGACCHECGRDCTLTEESRCFGDAWMGLDTACEPNPCPQSPGACCAPDASCTVTLYDACSPPATWVCGWLCAPNHCPQPVGACCDPPTGNCVMGTEVQCQTPRLWHPDWTTCYPNPCPQPQIGACCSAYDGSCALTPEVYCGAAGGAYTWHRDWTTCAPNPCPQPQVGACCSPYDGSCLLIAAEYCPAWSTWHSDWVTCTPNPCPQSQLGACCHEYDHHCTLIAVEYCLAPDAWHGEWTTCSPNPCPDGHEAACCDPYYGYCYLRIESYCHAPDVWHSDWLSCDPNPCLYPIGTCCYPNGHCELMLWPDCVGNWTLGGDCDPNPCPQPFGACCFDDGTCRVLTLVACAEIQGVYQGNYTDCNPNECSEPVPTERTSWGRIKNTYR